MKLGHRYVQREGHVRTQRSALYKPRTAAQKKPINTLTSDFEPPELGDNTHLLPEPPNLWHFVKAAQQPKTECSLIQQSKGTSC